MAFLLKKHTENYTCLSTDTKLTTVQAGSKCEEIDTGKEYIFDGTDWNQIVGATTLTGSLANVTGELPVELKNPVASFLTSPYLELTAGSSEELFVIDFSSGKYLEWNLALDESSGRTLQEVIDNVYFEVMYYSTTAGVVVNTRKFYQKIELSAEDNLIKGLIISGDIAGRTEKNIILKDKPYTSPLGQHMSIKVVNNHSVYTFAFRGTSLFLVGNPNV